MPLLDKSLGRRQLGRRGRTSRHARLSPGHCDGHRRLNPLAVCKVSPMADVTMYSTEILRMASNGLWGFKPTSQRFTNVGIGASIGGTSRNQVGGPSSTSLIPGTMGPMAHSCRDLELFAQVILAARPWETAPLLMPLPWRHVTPSGELDGMGKWKGANGKPRIGVIRDDGVVRPLKPVRRALDRCVSALQDAGMQMVEMEIGELIDAAETWKLTVCSLAKFDIHD